MPRCIHSEAISYSRTIRNQVHYYEDNLTQYSKLDLLLPCLVRGIRCDQEPENILLPAYQDGNAPLAHDNAKENSQETD